MELTSLLCFLLLPGLLYGEAQHELLPSFIADFQLFLRQFPLRLKDNKPVQWYSIALVLFGLVAVGLTLAGYPHARNLLYGYLITVYFVYLGEHVYESVTVQR